MDFDKLIEDNQKMVKKRLSFDFLNNSGASGGPYSASKKRKFSEVEIADNSSKTTRGDESLNSSVGSIGTSWEIKLLRSDLIEAQSRITQMKKEIHHQTTIQSELEMKFIAKEKALESEKNHFKNKAAEYERILKKNRKNEGLLKEETLKAKNQLNANKQIFDKQLFSLKNENDSLKETLSYKINELNNQISELSRENAMITSQYATAEEERETLLVLNETLKEKLEGFQSIKSELEQEKINYQNAQMKIKELEYVVNSFGDWKDLSKASHSRMQSVCDIEKELDRLKQTNKNLHDSLGNKLLLEERVHDLEARLERNEKSNVDQIQLKVQLEALEKEVKDWRQLSLDYSQKGSANNPINLRSYIEKLLHRDLLLVSEKSTVSTEKSFNQSQLNELKTQTESSQKLIESLRKSLKNHQSVLAKLQKKLVLVTAERDSQRQLLDNYEKDLTVTQGAPTNSAEVHQSRIRIEMLEKTVNGYKDLCTKLETELADARGHPGQLDGIIHNEQYETLRKDLEALRIENEKLKKRKNELEIEVENLTLRHNVMGSEARFKVIHLKSNPTAVAQEQVANEIVKLKAEVERLRMRNQKLEAGNDDLTARLNDTMNITMNVKELQILRDEHRTLQAKYKENEQTFASVNQELREVIYMLFGYKLDRFANSNYRIVSMYADNETDELLFQLNSQGTLDMLETEYSKTLETLMNQYLRSSTGCLPAFTSGLTLDLVLRATMTTM